MTISKSLSSWNSLTINRPTSEIDYYGVTFDHLVPTDDYFPEVLQINICEIDVDQGEYANTYLPFPVDPADYIGKKILAVPRCCQKRKGSTDRSRVNGSVTHKELIRQGFDEEVIMRLLIAYGIYSTKIPTKRFDEVPQPRANITLKGTGRPMALTESLAATDKSARGHYHVMEDA